MCAAKSPISILQEYTMSRHYPFPSYDIIQQGTGFKCVCTVGDIQKVAVAESKKRAKHICAERILEILQPCYSGVKQLPSYDELDRTIHATICIKMEDQDFNAVGKLNELCSKHGRMFPTYAEIGMFEQKFLIQCTLLNYVTQGKAANKKQAKQLAAKEMLNSVQTADFQASLVKEERELQFKKQLYHNTEIQEKVVELFKQLSTSTKRLEPQSQDDPLAFFKNDTPMRNVSDVEVGQDKKTSFDVVEALNEIELRNELSRLKVSFSISTLQPYPYPLILALKTQPIDGIAYSFIHFGHSYTEAVVGVLRKALHGIHILLKSK